MPTIKTQDEMIQSQKGWSGRYPPKHRGYMRYRVWVVFEDGRLPKGFRSTTEAMDYIKEDKS